MLLEVHSKCGERARTEHLTKSTTNEHKNPKEGRPTGLRRGGKLA